MILTSGLFRVSRSIEYCNGEADSSYIYNHQNLTEEIYMKYKLNQRLQKDKIVVCFGPRPKHGWVVIFDKTKKERCSRIETDRQKLLIENTIACKISQNNKFIGKGFYECFGNYKCMDIYFKTGFFSYLSLIISDFFETMFSFNIC